VTRRIDIICLTYGEPETPGLIGQYRYSRSILKRLTRLISAIPKPVLPIIAIKRAIDRWRDQSEREFSSPLEPISKRFANDLQLQLSEHIEAIDLRVHLALEFRAPTFKDILQSLPVEEVDQVLVLPLYVADSSFTSGISKIDYQELRAKGVDWQDKIQWLSCPNGDAEFGQLVVDHVLTQCTKEGLQPEDLQSAHFVCGVHGTLLDPPEGLDNGLQTTLAHRDAVRSKLEPLFASFQVGWLNHTRGGAWTEPAMDQLGDTLARANAKPVIYYPLGFLADNAESLLEGPDALSGLPDLVRLPCLNNHPGLVTYYRRRISAFLTKQVSKSESLNKEMHV